MTPAAPGTPPRREVTLAETYLFRDLPVERLSEYAARMQWRRYPRGTYLCRIGDPANVIFILASGAIRGSRLGPDGEEFVDMEVSRPGDIVGETAAVIDGETRMMDGLAIEDTECGVLAADTLFELLESDPILMRRLLARLAELVRERSRFLASMTFLDTTGRVAAKLLELAATHGRPTEDQGRTSIRMTQRVLASMVLASRESVNRSLATLAAEEAIEQRPGAIVICRPDVLRRRAHYDDQRP